MSRYWLMKSEPGCFSIDDLRNAPNSTSPWDGVRNYQARNFMRDDMRKGDKVLFYHSVTNPSVVGVAEVARESYPDDTAWDPENNHFDPKSTPESPRWFMVDVRFVRKFDQPIPLAQLKGIPELAGMELIKKGSRLSVMPVSQQEYETICAMANG